MKRVYYPSLITKIINNQFPNFAIESVSFFGAGYDSEAYLINNEYVFKFPKYQAASMGLYQEAAVLQQLKDKLPLPIPDPEFIGKPNHHFDKYFMGYRKLPGTVLTPQLFNSLSADIRDNIAKDVASFLKSLHQIQLPAPVDGLEQDIKADYFADYEMLEEVLFPDLNATEKKRVERVFQKILSHEILFCYEPRLAHHDLSADHLLFDETTNRICGVIDFGDVAITDADYDFLYFLEESDEELGRAFGLKVMDYYQHPDQEQVIKKADFRQFYWPFEQVMMGYNYGLDDWYREGLEKIRNLLF